MEKLAFMKFGVLPGKAENTIKTLPQVFPGIIPAILAEEKTGLYRQERRVKNGY